MLQWEEQLPAALARAETERRVVLADFVKDDCAGCHALSTITLADPAVQQLIATHFVPLRLNLSRRSDRLYFRRYQIIWTPTIAMLDRRGTLQYQAPGFHPVELFIPLLRIGLARTQIAWARYREAAEQLTMAADPAGPLAAEALYWLGMTYYLAGEHQETLDATWRRLRTEHPSSLWAARIPPSDL
ncbi:MAG TPA: thioredoxin family protein [Roseiflexaceae bacterium]|nr:thioredoxin family protein [Roseiflexaceae bacterium]HMP40515.1 thioredoxin family protein [Roseiflexaceae bacterium]